MKQFRSTALLLVITIIFGGYLYFRERGPVAGVGNTVLLRTEPDSVKQIFIHQPDSQISLMKTGDIWSVKSKTESVPADPDTVKELLDSLQMVQSGSIVTKPEKLNNYGLDATPNYIAIDATKISFGDSPSFDRNQIYVQVKTGNNSTIALLSTALRDEVFKTFTDWRDKAVLRFDSNKVTRVQISAPNINATFDSIKDNDAIEWRITKPVVAKADSNAVNSFLASLRNAQTKSFQDNDPKDLNKWGLQKPEATVKIFTTDGIKELRVGKSIVEGVVAQNSFSKAVFVLPKNVYSLINRKLSDWRDKDLLTYDTGKVKQMQISARGRTVVLNLSGTKWTASNPKLDKTLVGNAASDFLVGIQKLQAQSFIDVPKADAAYGLNHPALKVELTSSQWEGSKTLEMVEHDGKTYARIIGTDMTSNTIYIMPANALNSFSKAIDHLFGK